MASYAEIYQLSREDSLLKQRVAVACLIAAEAVRVESDQTANHANRLLWAKGAFVNPDDAGERMLFAVLATNKGLSAAQIKASTDAQLQSAVDAAVNFFATGA